MKLTLVRHGRTPWNEAGRVQGQADPPLNKEGIIQATSLAEKLKDEISSYSAIYCSNMIRAKQTAEIIKSNAEVPLVLDTRLKSRNLGILSGLTLEEIKELDPDKYRRWMEGDRSFIPPKGEGSESLYKRTLKFYNALQKVHNGNEKIMIVTHRESIGILIELITKEKVEDVLTGIKNCTPYFYEI